MSEAEPADWLAGHAGPVGQAAFSPDGGTLLPAVWDQTARLWGVSAGVQRAAYTRQIGRLLSLAVAPEGMTAAAGGEDGRIAVWDLE